jgi:phosphoribosylaminoimidazole-succinocarboxamide synthase
MLDTQTNWLTDCQPQEELQLHDNQNQITAGLNEAEQHKMELKGKTNTKESEHWFDQSLPVATQLC